MIMDALLAAISGDPGIADWKIFETRKSQAESFFVGAALDMTRRVESTELRLVVYADTEEDGKRLRGEASAIVHPTMGSSEIKDLVHRAAFAAARSRNPWFPLPEPASARIKVGPSAFEQKEAGAWMAELAEALYRHDGSSGSRINSLELFLSRSEVRILSSRGIDVGFVRHRGYAEYTVETSSTDSPGGVELTDELSFSEPDFGRLSDEVARRLSWVRERAAARSMPRIQGLPLLLGGREAEAALAWFFGNSSSSRIYAKTSPFALGVSVHGTEAKAGNFDPVGITAEALLPGCPASAPYDLDGFPLAPTPCIEAGIAKAFVGPGRYAHYLGLPPSGDYGLFSAAGGSLTDAELRSRPHLEVAFFSNFNMDLDSGDFGGEVRLAWHFDGKTRRPITGGSVTGSMFENRGLMRLSRERSLASSMFGPSTVLLPLVSVTPAS